MPTQMPPPHFDFLANMTRFWIWWVFQIIIENEPRSIAYNTFSFEPVCFPTLCALNFGNNANFYLLRNFSKNFFEVQNQILF